MKIFPILLLALAGTAHAEIYKCTGADGRPQFSDKPCADDAEVVELKEGNSGISIGPESDFRQIKHSNAKRDYDRDIARIEGAIRRLNKERTDKLNRLDKEYSTLPRNQRTYGRRKEIQREMRSLRTHYSNQINKLYEQKGEARDRYSTITR